MRTAATGRGVSEPRRARADEAPALAALVERAYTHYVARIGLRPGTMDADYDEVVRTGEVWVVDGDVGDVAGLIVLHQLPDHLVLENIAVDPAYQGGGVGRALLDLAEERALTRGLGAIELFTHALMTENQRIYEARGYVRTARVDEEGFDRYYYRKELR